MANWDILHNRGNVEDRRGLAPVALGGSGLVGIVVMIAFTLLSGGDAGDILARLESIPVPAQNSVSAEQFRGQDDYEVFASTVLGSNNELWSTIFAERNQTYSPPKLVLFRQATTSSCGSATSEVGPHYCPRDATIYLDETFFDELTARFGAAGGDVAEAYVIAHEVAHHAQNQLGLLPAVHQASQQNPDRANDLSVKLELQADCFAGLWAHSLRDRNVFEPGELQEALDAAAAVGDDRIQTKTQGQINPETWTHGSSEQRVAWFNRGLEQGNFQACDTFR